MTESSEINSDARVDLGEAVGEFMRVATQEVGAKQAKDHALKVVQDAFDHWAHVEKTRKAAGRRGKRNPGRITTQRGK